MSARTKRLVALSGPSCVGKGPLLAAVRTFRPEIVFSSLTVIKSRESRPGGPRPDEVELWDDPDYFRPQAEIESLPADRYLRATSHGYPQALDLQRVGQTPHDLVVVEACCQINAELQTATALTDWDITTVFMSPLSATSFATPHGPNLHLRGDIESFMADLLVLRTLFHNPHFEDAKAERGYWDDADLRTRDAVEELAMAHQFDYVLVNKAFEGVPQWNREPSGPFRAAPEGRAAATLDTFAQLLAGQPSEAFEIWTPDTFCP